MAGLCTLKLVDQVKLSGLVLLRLQNNHNHSPGAGRPGKWLHLNFDAQISTLYSLLYSDY
jgi:hypothetical protein